MGRVCQQIEGLEDGMKWEGNGLSQPTGCDRNRHVHVATMVIMIRCGKEAAFRYLQVAF